jgi:hypothetical protein
MAIPRATSVLIAAALLAGCGGPQAQIAPVATSGVHAAASYGNCPALSGGTGILADGDFSQAQNPGGYFINYAKGQVFAPDWQVAKRTIDFVGTTFWNMAGLCSIDLDGNSAGGIQTGGFEAKVGVTYTVTFLLSGNGCEGIGYGPQCPSEKKCKIAAANQFQLFTWDTSGYNDIEHGVYSEESWQFAGRGKRLSNLSFLSQDDKASGRGCVVASFSITKS